MHTGRYLAKEGQADSLLGMKEIKDECKSNSRLCPRTILLPGRCRENGLLFFKSDTDMAKDGGTVIFPVNNLSYNVLLVDCTLNPDELDLGLF